MSFPFFNTKKQQVITILDIGSSSVGVAIVALKENASPEILFSVREDMVFQQDLNLKRFTSAMLQAVGKVLIKLEKSGQEKSHTFSCILSSPWYESETKIIKLKKDKPFIVTEKIVDELTEKEVLGFRKIVNKDDNKKNIVEIIDIKNIQIKLNGYETSKPYGKEAKILEISLFLALGSKKILNDIKNKIAETFYIENITFKAFSLISFSVIRDIFSDKNNFLFLDVTGEVTDLSIIKDGIIKKSASFPFGKNFILRRIASEMNTTLEEAESLLKITEADKSTKELNLTLDKILVKIKKEWVSAFLEKVILISEGRPLPNIIFLTVDSDIAKWVVGFLEKEKFDQIILTNDMFDVRLLDIKTLEKFCVFKRNVKKDSFLALEAIFVSRNHDIY